MMPKKQDQKERKVKTGTKRAHIFVPLVVMLMLICVIPTIILVGNNFGRPQETSELNKDVEQKEEQVSAASVAISAGNTYAIEKTGIYKIELHGGRGKDGTDSTGSKGAKVTAYVKLNEGDVLTTESHTGGAKAESGHTGAGGDGLRLYVRNK